MTILQIIMVTNEDIREYAKEKYGFTPKNAWIAHAKEVYGLPVTTAHNRGEQRKWLCPKKRLAEFEEIFKHLGMIKKSKN